MPTSQIDAARAAHRARQGNGARFDAPEAPFQALDLARRGTAYFARLLNRLAYGEFDRQSQRPGVSRAALIAELGLDARALAVALEGIRTGVHCRPFYANPADRLSQIEMAATLPRHALCHLFRHSATHLNVEWRDLSAAHWTASIMLPACGERAVSETPFDRARAIWSAALDLDAGGRLIDLPEALLNPFESLLTFCTRVSK